MVLRIQKQFRRIRLKKVSLKLQKAASKQVYETVDYTAGSLTAADADEDGYGETLFMYAIAADGMDAFPMKMIYHVKGQKNVLGAQVAQTAEQFDQVYKAPAKAEALKGLDSKLKGFAFKKWNASIAKFKSSLN